MMRFHPVRCCLFAVGLCMVSNLSAQLKRGPVGPDGVHAALPKPCNLKVLPPDIAIPDLVATMVGFSNGLGVQCTHCHVPRPGIDPDYDLDFASDANPNKNKARVMIRMTNDINHKFLAELGDSRAGTPITCGNCHQGHNVPQTYTPPPGFVVK